MVYQTGRQVTVAYKAQSAIGTPESGTGAAVFRANSGGMSLSKAAIQSAACINSGMMTRGRHGQRSVTGSYPCDITLGTFDELMQAALRGTWESELVLDESDFTSITTTTSTIVAATGSWITLGLRGGDVIRLTNHSSSDRP